MYSIGNFLIQIKNAYMAHKRTIRLPYSNAGFSIGRILEEEKYIKSIKKAEEEGKKYLEISLLYNGKEPSLTDVRLVSTPSAHMYTKKTGVKKTLREYGTTIVSTSKGMMTGKKAAQMKIGGELICKLS